LVGYAPIRLEKEAHVKASILIVGDDPVLLHTRAELLRDWRIASASSREAEQAILARPYELLILCQTVQEKAGRSLIEEVLHLHPKCRILTIRSAGERQLGSQTYQVELNNPGGLRSTVAKILDACPTPAGV
jgi:DNA-binding NtrC family response regulator